jgi:hypothetical protein
MDIITKHWIPLRNGEFLAWLRDYQLLHKDSSHVVSKLSIAVN